MKKLQFLKVVMIIELFIFGSCSDLVNDNSKDLRNLSDCSSYTDCAACNEQSSCIYQNGKCQRYLAYDLAKTDYSLSSYSNYCHNMESDGYLDINDFGGNINLYANSNASETQFGEWRIYVWKDKKLKISVKKNSENNEEIYIHTNTDNKSNYFYPKSFVDCNSEEFEITLESTTFLDIKVRAFNSKSDYVIKITQEKDLIKQLSTFSPQ